MTEPTCAYPLPSRHDQVQEACGMTLVDGVCPVHGDPSTIAAAMAKAEAGLVKTRDLQRRYPVGHVYPAINHHLMEITVAGEFWSATHAGSCHCRGEDGQNDC